MLRQNSKERIAVALSGGVDSSYCAWLMKDDDLHFDAFYMRNWYEENGDCPYQEDVAILMSVCAKLGKRLQVLDFSHEYWDRVFNDYTQQLRQGYTPNPDTWCNQKIKFGSLLQAVIDKGYDRLITGHYARILDEGNEWRLYKAIDKSKDQSYFLYLLDQDMLAHSAFPLGDWRKSEVRRGAQAAGLINYARKDSVGICFIGAKKWRDFISEYLRPKAGEICHLETGKVLGSHQGACLYTIGQRQGLGLGGIKGYPEQAWYVADKDIDKNIVYVVGGKNHPALYRRWVAIDRVHWIGEPPPANKNYRCKWRHQQVDRSCRITDIGERNCQVRLDRPGFAITPGQALVLYQGDWCLGGGVIKRSEYDG